jgi:hypothetical protein
MRLPTSDEINVYGSLDEKVALQHFLGKTPEQAEALFREDSLHKLFDLMWMGPKAFCFYVPAAVNYIRSNASSGDSDAISCFLAVLEFRRAYERDEVTARLPDLRTGVRYILENWARFDIDPDIYGDLWEKYVNLSRQLDTQSGAAADRPSD